MKQLLVLVLALCFCFPTKATQQAPDKLHYQEQQFKVRTGWGHPSPLETYFQQKNQKTPFTALSTGNYRGHVAVWLIEGQKLYLDTIRVGGKSHLPCEFAVQSKQASSAEEKRVFADWFSGVIVGWPTAFDETNPSLNKSYYFHIHHGQIINAQSLSFNEHKQIDNNPDDIKPNSALAAKKAMLELNNRYIAYYYRLYTQEAVSIDGQKGLLRGNAGKSPLLSFYDNDHLKWPYNWKNATLSGAPNGQWHIKDKRLYLTGLDLNLGLGFYEIDKKTVPLEKLFAGKVTDKGVFADWVSAVFVIEYPDENAQQANLQNPTITSRNIIQVKNGVVTATHLLPLNIDVDNLGNSLPHDVLQLYKEWRKQMLM